MKKNEKIDLVDLKPKEYVTGNFGKTKFAEEKKIPTKLKW